MKTRQIYNPYLPLYEYIPDGEPRVFNGRLYIFGSHDRFGAESFCENDYVTWSAPLSDLSDWRYEGVIFRKEQDPLNPKGKYPLFAPDVIDGKDGKYYLFYAPAGTDSIGVAVSARPEGPYDFAGHVRHQDGVLLGRKEGDPFPFDPGVYVDEDGTVFLYFGFAPMTEFMKPTDITDFVPVDHCAGSYSVILDKDMRTIRGTVRPVVIEGCPDWGHSFFEASSMRRISSKYYFIYSSQNSHELCYAIGEKPFGYFHYGGVIFSNGDIGYEGRKEKDRVTYTGNNHGSLACLNGQWYIFGHRMTNYSSFSRQGTAELVTILEDGTIPQVEITSCGLNDGALAGEGTYPASIACHLTSAMGAFHYCGMSSAEEKKKHPVFRQDGEDREEKPDQHVANIRKGTVTGYKYFDMTGTKKISVMSRGGEGSFLISTMPGGPWTGEIKVTGGREWHESCDAIVGPFPRKKTALYFTWTGEDSVDFRSFTISAL